MARSSVDRARDRVARVASHVDASSATRDDGRDARARAMAAHVASNAAGAVVHASDDATPWIDVDQRRIDAFAACADDHQFIHARDAPGGAIAHGFLTLSLLTPATASRTTPAWSSRAVNYGLNRVRFVAPVRAGARVRARLIKIVACRALPDAAGVETEYLVELETAPSALAGAASRPALALVASWVVRHYV